MLISAARYNEVKTPIRKINSARLDSTATEIYQASTSIYIEDATVLLANIDSANSRYTLWQGDSSAVNVTVNQVVSDHKIPKKSHPKKAIPGFGDDQKLSGKSSGNVVVATLYGRKLDRS